jgi:ribosomal protein S18 acetylase RimI-like enzyme
VEREHRAWKTGWNVKIFSASVISDNEAVISVLQRKDYEEVKRVENYYKNHELQASLGDHVSIFFKKRVTDEERLEALGCNDSYALGDEGQLIRLRPRSKL